jgi:hypothetical protein
MTDKVFQSLPESMQTPAVHDAIQKGLETAAAAVPSLDVTQMHFAGIYTQAGGSFLGMNGNVGVASDGNTYWSAGPSRGAGAWAQGVDATAFAVFANPGKGVSDVITGPSIGGGAYDGFGGSVFANSSGVAVGVGIGAGGRAYGGTYGNQGPPVPVPDMSKSRGTR